jgi:hypothetical protein
MGILTDILSMEATMEVSEVIDSDVWELDFLRPPILNLRVIASMMDCATRQD